VINAPGKGKSGATLTAKNASKGLRKKLLPLLLKKQQNKTRELMFSDAPGAYHGAFFFVYLIFWMIMAVAPRWKPARFWGIHNSHNSALTACLLIKKIANLKAL